MEKLLDLRFVIGIFFLVVGVLLLAHSFLATHAAGEDQSVNQWCGGSFILFSIIMLILSFRKK